MIKEIENRLNNGKMIRIEEIKWLLEQTKKVQQYKEIIGTIANIDSQFMDYDNEKEFPYDKALDKIDELVQPVWKEIVEGI